jgi:hypothetical protein
MPTAAAAATAEAVEKAQQDLRAQRELLRAQIDVKR